MREDKPAFVLKKQTSKSKVMMHMIQCVGIFFRQNWKSCAL